MKNTCFSNNIEYILLHKITFRCKKTDIDASICLCKFPISCLSDKTDLGFLSDKEKKCYDGKNSKKRKHSYMLGRYAAKEAVKLLDNNIGSRNINILNSIFGYPYLEVKYKTDLQITLSHSCEYGLAAAFPNYLRLGIDIEKVNCYSYNGIQNIIAKEIEKINLNHSKLSMEQLTMVWSVKEALSKCILLGLTVPMELFELETISISKTDIKGTFKNFAMYQYFSMIYHGYCISIVYPKETKLTTDIYDLLSMIAD